MAYYDSNGNAIDQATYQKQFAGDYSGALGGLSYAMKAGQIAQNQKKGAAYAAADATAEREAQDYTAQANQQTADRQNSLAQQLATARYSPGGGLRRGMGRGSKGMTASNATPGLTAANAAAKLSARKAELRAQVDEEFANKPQQNYSFSVGPAISLW